MVTNRRWFIPYLVGFMASGTPITGAQGWCLAFFKGFCRSGAHTLARSIWATVVSSQPYDEAKAIDTTRRLKNLHHQAHSLNLKLVPT